jgi:hypothetical protein
MEGKSRVPDSALPLAVALVPRLVSLGQVEPDPFRVTIVERLDQVQRPFAERLPDRVEEDKY